MIQRAGRDEEPAPDAAGGEPPLGPQGPVCVLGYPQGHLGQSLPRQSSSFSIWPRSPGWGQWTRRGLTTSGPRSSSSSAESVVGRRVGSVVRAWGRLVGRVPRLPSGVAALSGLGDAPGIRLPSLMDACRGAPSHVGESRMSARRPSHRQSEGPERQLGIHLPSGLQLAYPEGGALRRSEPIGPKGTPMYLCPWHAGAAIRTDVG